MKTAGTVTVPIRAAGAGPVAIACIITGGWVSFRPVISRTTQKRLTTGRLSILSRFIRSDE